MDNKNKEDSTQNSDRTGSNEKVSSLSLNKKKSFAKILNKRASNIEVS